MERKFYSTIKPSLYRSVLFRGSCIGGAGALLLLLSGTFFPLSFLEVGGIPLAFVSFSLIAIGLLPIRRLMRLSSQPDLLICQSSALFYHKKGKLVLQLPFSLITSLHFHQDGEQYGIGIKLSKIAKNHLQTLHPHVNLTSFFERSQAAFPAFDLFLPFFSEQISTDLLELLSLEG